MALILLLVKKKTLQPVLSVRPTKNRIVSRALIRLRIEKGDHGECFCAKVLGFLVPVMEP